MDREATFLSRCAAKGPLVVLEDHLYQVIPEDRGERVTLCIGSNRFSAVTAGEIKQWELFERRRQAETLFSSKKSYIEQVLDQQMKHDTEVEMRHTLNDVRFDV